MKLKTLTCGFVVAWLAVAAMGQSSRSVLGKWQGERQGVPFVTVNVTTEKDGELSGTAVFYILDQREIQGKPRVLGKQEVQLVDPKLAANVLSFKIRNQQGDVTMNASSGEELEFQMILGSDTEATLKSENREPAPIKLLKLK